MNIFLIGYRCTGKTTIGKILAERTGRQFFDTDDELVKRAGETIKEMVEKKGWSAFRRLEREIVRGVCVNRGQIVATGGGVVLDDENVSLMKANGTLVWLRASVETIAKRILSDRTSDEYRPSLTDRGAVAEIENTLTEREPLYQRAMDLDFDTDRQSIETVAESIIKTLKDKTVLPYSPNGALGE